MDYDTDQDGKLMIEDFIKMILPKDYQIEDKDEWKKIKKIIIINKIVIEKLKIKIFNEFYL